jgi:hypothetical protein
MGLVLKCVKTKKIRNYSYVFLKVVPAKFASEDIRLTEKEQKGQCKSCATSNKLKDTFM